jgi:hypothetical protein
VSNLDVVIVSCKQDLNLLRLCITSLIEHVSGIGNVYVVAPSSIKKDFIFKVYSKIKHIDKQSFNLSGMSEYQKQILIKLLVVDQIASDNYWVIDSDFLFLKRMDVAVLFKDGRPKAYYDELNEVNMYWAKLSEAIMEEEVNYNFMAVPVYILQRDLVKKLIEKYRLMNNLEREYSEFCLYFAFCFKYYHDLYSWNFKPVDQLVGEDVPGISVSQLPPTYLNVNRAEINKYLNKKFLVIWSHWAEAVSFNYFQLVKTLIRIPSLRKLFILLILSIKRPINIELRDLSKPHEIRICYTDGKIHPKINLKIVEKSGWDSIVLDIQGIEDFQNKGFIKTNGILSTSEPRITRVRFDRRNSNKIRMHLRQILHTEENGLLYYGLLKRIKIDDKSIYEK